MSDRLQRLLLAALRSQLDDGKARPPEGGIVLWNAFSALSRQRTWHGHGPNPIPVSEVEAFCRLMRLPLEPKHVGIILAMDRAWLDHVMASMKTSTDKPGRHVSKQGLTPALMDAMFP